MSANTQAKLTYIDGTKQAIKEALIEAGADVTDATTFRDYADIISSDLSIYKQLVFNTFGSHVIGFWPFDETEGVTANDISSNGHDAAYVGAVTLNQDGIFGTKCANFTAGSANIYSEALKAKINFSEGYFSIWVAANAEAVWNSMYMLGLGANDANRIFIRMSGTIVFYYIAGGTNKSISFDRPSGTKFINIGFRWSKTGEKITAFINGKPVSSVSTLGTWVGDLSNTFASVMAYAGGDPKFNGKGSHALLLDYAPTDAEIYTTVKPSGLLMYEGDSRSNQKNWQGIASNYIANSINKFNFRKYAYQSVAVSGATPTDIITRAATTNGYILDRGVNVLVVWVGVNGGQNAATIYTNLTNYCNAAKLAGWDKIIVCTEIDAQDASREAIGWHSTIYPALNILIRNDHSFADAIADLGARTELQNALDTTYFNADKVHLSDAGYTVVAEVVGAALAELF